MYYMTHNCPAHCVGTKSLKLGKCWRTFKREQGLRKVAMETQNRVWKHINMLNCAIGIVLKNKTLAQF